jgi:hypothetical protein
VRLHPLNRSLDYMAGENPRGIIPQLVTDHRWTGTEMTFIMHCWNQNSPEKY